MMTTTMGSGVGGGRGAGREVVVLAVVGALVPAALLALITGSGLVLVGVPAVCFGVPAMSAPALYVALTLRGDAPPMGEVAGALRRGLAALALAQLGLAAPVGFLAATATTATAVSLVAAATLGSAAVAAVALDAALRGSGLGCAMHRTAVLWVWITVTAVIAFRLYSEVVAGVTS